MTGIPCVPLAVCEKSQPWPFFTRPTGGQAEVFHRLLVVVTAMAVAASSAACAGEPDTAAIARWIDELGSPQFAQREAASKSLVAAGHPAVPAVEAAILRGDLEVATRGIEIVRELLAGEPELAAEAEAVLERCAEQGGPATGRLAEATLDFHYVGTAAAARTQLESLGAVFEERPLVEQAGLEVVFGQDWTGGVEDLRQLVRLRGLVAVGFHGVPIDSQTLAIIGRLERLKQLELFGTGLEDAAVTELAARLPAARIDVRQGGKLGVGAIAFGGPCEVRTVEPGSAADQAGVRAGDVILAVDDMPIADFDGLTARVAGRRPGEQLRLLVSREGGAGGDLEQLEFDVRLDAW